VSIACFAIGGLWLRFEAAHFRRVWQDLRRLA
jgi:hypothetical protein